MSLFPDTMAPESGDWTTQQVEAIDGISELDDRLGPLLWQFDAGLMLDRG